MSQPSTTRRRCPSCRRRTHAQSSPGRLSSFLGASAKSLSSAGQGLGTGGGASILRYSSEIRAKLAKCTAAAARSRSTRTATCVFLLPAMNGPTSWLKLEAAAPNLRVLATGRTAAASPAGSRGVSGLTAELEATARRAVARPLNILNEASCTWARFHLNQPLRPGAQCV